MKHLYLDEFDLPFVKGAKWVLLPMEIDKYSCVEFLTLLLIKEPVNEESPTSSDTWTSTRIYIPAISSIDLVEEIKSAAKDLRTRYLYGRGFIPGNIPIELENCVYGDEPLMLDTEAPF